MKPSRPVPAYKARLAQRAERLEEFRAAQAHVAFANWQAEYLRKQWAEQDAERKAREAKRQAPQEPQTPRAKPERPSFFRELAVALGWRRAG
jgi:hypothetical protein